ncbi:hypothetical protein E2P81_ATG06689 [Venturia nashicola]|uniref:Uncharacterized protein n=1 Tax=Venturia nashicola TaxID=86259 RepID=A0A4Z1NWP0_9PEZI|nr:hypothetical protein E6O75_ATG06860 [Venturia nashicola]TLD30036.1 hypothetical protein E2P81_ATG06689 [Venturia nashicola]
MQLSEESKVASLFPGQVSPLTIESGAYRKDHRHLKSCNSLRICSSNNMARLHTKCPSTISLQVCKSIAILPPTQTHEYRLITPLG